MKLSTADKLITACELFRAHIGNELPIQSAQFFLEIHRYPGRSIGWYADRLNLRKSTVSRTIKIYSERGMKDPLVDIELDPEDHRLRVVKLTRRGSTIVDNIIERFEQKEKEL